MKDLLCVPSGAERDAILPLFTLADDSEGQVLSYYQTGDLYAFLNEARHPIGIVLVLPQAAQEAELKVVAVDKLLQGQGVGKELVQAVLDKLRRDRIRRVTVGTSTSGIGQIAFYQKLGFRMFRIERDFFSEKRGYPAGIQENGIPLRDLVWMDQLL